MALTPKQEKFAQCVASGMNQSAAYRAAYDAGEMSAPAINTEAYVMAQNPDIAHRIEELRIPLEEQVGITLKSHIARLQALGAKAEGVDKFEAALKAEELTGKVLGYYVNKTELTGRGGGAVEHKIVREILDPADGSNKDTNS